MAVLSDSSRLAEDGNQTLIDFLSLLKGSVYHYRIPCRFPWNSCSILVGMYRIQIGPLKISMKFLKDSCRWLQHCFLILVDSYRIPTFRTFVDSDKVPIRLSWIPTNNCWESTTHDQNGILQYLCLSLPISLYSPISSYKQALYPPSMPKEERSYRQNRIAISPS